MEVKSNEESNSLFIKSFFYHSRPLTTDNEIVFLVNKGILLQNVNCTDFISYKMFTSDFISKQKKKEMPIKKHRSLF